EHFLNARHRHVRKFPIQAEPGVVDEEVQGLRAASADVGVQALGSVRLGQVEDNLLDRNAVRRPNLARDAGAPLCVTRHQVQRIAPRGKLARQYHPDLQDTPAKKKVAEEKFKEINEAHEVLGDPEKRKKYDQLGSRWKDGMEFTPPPGSGHAGSWTWTGGEAFSGGFSDFFEALFGGRGGPFSRGQSSWEWDLDEQAGGRDQGADLEAELELPLEELAQGGTRRVTLTARDASGRLRPTQLDVTLPKGVRPGDRIRLKGQGATNGRTARPGDLYLKIRLQPHPFYTLLAESPDDL